MSSKRWTVTLQGGPADGRVVSEQLMSCYVRLVVPELFGGRFVKHEYSPDGAYVGVLREWVRSCPFDVDLFPRWTRFRKCFRRFPERRPQYDEL